MKSNKKYGKIRFKKNADIYFYPNEEIDKKIKITEGFIDLVIGGTKGLFANNNERRKLNISVTQDLIKDIKESLQPKGGLYNLIEKTILMHFYRGAKTIRSEIIAVIASYVNNKYLALSNQKIIEKNNKFKENIEKQKINKKGLRTLIREQNNNINQNINNNDIKNYEIKFDNNLLFSFKDNEIKDDQNINKNNDIKNYEIKFDNNLLFSFKGNEIKDENKIKHEKDYNIDVKNLSKNNPLREGINECFPNINNIIISDDERNELEQKFKNEIDHQDNDTDSVNEELNLSFDDENTEMLKDIEYVNNYFINKNKKIDKNEYFQNQNKINDIQNDKIKELERLFKIGYLSKKELDERKKAIENKQQNKINEIQNDKKDISNYNQKQEINIKQNRLLDAGRNIMKNFQDPFNSKHIRGNNNIGFKK